MTPWYRPSGLAGVVEDLAAGAKVAAAPASLRMPLSPEEAERMVVLGSDTAAALEGAMRAWQPRIVQGGPIGYLSREFDVVPGTPGAAETTAAGTAFAWNPTVRGAKSEDTFIVAGDGAVPVTNTADWPVVLGRPAILPTSLPG